MTNPNIQIGDEVRAMTDAEYKAHKADMAAQTAAIETVAAAKASAHAKLLALGLTDAEIVALVGKCE
jgi:hypothetical protein